MTIRIAKKQIVPIIVLVVLVVAIFLADRLSSKKAEPTVLGTNIAVINVKSGYSPRNIILPANQETTLRFVTNNTYDCSAAISIPKFQIEKILPATGTTDVVLPPQESGTELTAGCAMGMYSFKLRFQ